MPNPLAADLSSVGVTDRFSGNFTKALYLRGQNSAELERRLGYGKGRLEAGWWMLFALEKPVPGNFVFGGYTQFSGSRIGDPKLGVGRAHVEQELAQIMGGRRAVDARKVQHLEALQISGPARLAKVLPVAKGTDYPVGSGIYQCNIPHPILCKVAAFVAPDTVYMGEYT